MHELEAYGFGLTARPMIIVGTKMDEEGAEKRLEELKKALPDKEIYSICSLSHEGIDALLYRVADLLDELPLFPLYNEENEEQGVRVYEAALPPEDDYEIVRKDAHTFVIQGERVPPRNTSYTEKKHLFENCLKRMFRSAKLQSCVRLIEILLIVISSIFCLNRTERFRAAERCCM